MADSQRTCTFPNCDKNVRSLGLCRGHYRQKLDGEVLRPLEVHLFGASLIEKLELRTKKTETCWIWTGSISSGYGELNFQGKSIRAHRAWYEHTHGPIPASAVLDHSCHNRLCCNPDHLTPVTPKMNNENRSGPPRNNKSGYRGVRWEHRRNHWVVNVGHRGRQYYGGSFDSVGDANRAAIELRNKLHTNNLLDRAVTGSP